MGNAPQLPSLILIAKMLPKTAHAPYASQASTTVLFSKNAFLLIQYAKKPILMVHALPATQASL